MATLVIMPRQGQSVESCIITSWEKSVGDSVNVGDILFSYETDKASFDEEAKVEGTLLAILHEEQDDVPCLEGVAIIGQEGEDFSDLIKDMPKDEDGNKEENTAPTQPAHKELQPAEVIYINKEDKEATSVSPRARATAERMKVDLSGINPSGPHGRIIERDVLSQGHSGTAKEAQVQTSTAIAHDEAADYYDEKLSNLRKIIGKSMHDSLSGMAQLTHHSSFDATNMIALRKQLKSQAESMGLPNITYNDILMFAVSRVLLKHPSLNAHHLGDTMRFFNHVHLGMAVDTERGLLVPTIFNADTKSLAEISREAKELAEAAQSGSINPDLLTGASFTVSNLGTLGIEMFTPVINPPQTGILGVDCMVDRVRKVDGNIDVYPAMGISLTYDHRALDGAPASRFLRDVKVAMENITAYMAM